MTWGDGADWEIDWATNGFFEGEVEPCINGNVLASGAYFGQEMRALVDRLLGEQLADGGWNCEVENGATVSSFGTTINVLEGLLAFERANPGSADVAASRRRGQAYLLERGLLRRKSTGELIDADFTRFSFPTWWHYDVLRGLDYLRDTGEAPDDRLAEAIDLVRQKRGRGRSMGPGAHPQGPRVRDDGRRRRTAEPLEHAPRDAGAPVGGRRATLMADSRRSPR